MIALILDGSSSESSVADMGYALMKDVLEGSGYAYRVFDRYKDRDDFLQCRDDISYVIPLVHGGIGEGGYLAALCELLGLPCLFTTHGVHSLCLDKQASNALVQSWGYTVPQSAYFLSGDALSPGFAGPYFVKPTSNGSSLDCGRFETLDEAADMIKKITDYDVACVQEVIEGREMTVSLAGDRDKDVEVLGIMEIETQREFFDFVAKYDLDQTREFFPDLEKELRDRLEMMCRDIYRRFQLTDLARIDLIVTASDIVFLEVNTIPGLSPTSFLPQCIRHAGYDVVTFFGDLIAKKMKK